MVVFYADHSFQDIGVLKSFIMDCELSAYKGKNTFEIRMPLGSIMLEEGYFIYVENEEYGGIVDSIKIDTKSKTIYYSGRTWRGILESRIIKPRTNQDYYYDAGYLSDIIDSLIIDASLAGTFYVDDTIQGDFINTYYFYRYTDMYSGIIRLLAEYDYKLLINFSPVRKKAVISIAPIVNYDNEKEITSDLFDFNITRTGGTVNHLIALGSGELKNRMVIDLYCDENGNISTTRTFANVDEIQDIYDYPNAEDETDLMNSATKRFKELIGSDKIKITLNDMNADIGDRFTAYEQLTGIQAVQYVDGKIVKITDDSLNIQYTANPREEKQGDTL